MKTLVVVLVLLGVCLSGPFLVEKLHEVRRIQEYDVNQDGLIVYSVKNWDAATNVATTNLQIVAEGSSPSPLTKKVGVNDFNPVFLNDKVTVLFLSTRSGDPQLFSVNVKDPENVKQLTQFPIPINSFKYNEKQNFLVLSLQIYPECNDDLGCTAQKDSDVTARGENSWMEFDDLYVRHWDTWETGKRYKLFTYDIQTRAIKGLMNSLEADCPVPPFGGSEQYDISPDGSEVAFTAELTAYNRSWTTGWKIFVVKVNATKPTPVSITDFTQARTQNPTYSPDGINIAYLAMDRPGFEADRLHVNLYNRDTKVTTPLTDKVDRSFSAITWDTFGIHLIAETDYWGYHSIFSINTLDKNIYELVHQYTNLNVKNGGKNYFVIRNSMTTPSDIWSFDFKNKSISGLKQLTFENKDVLKNIDLPVPEIYYFYGANNDPVNLFLIRPLGYKNTDKDSTWPLTILIHGGPESEFGDAWSYRWNPQLWAAQNYTVAMINFHGSVGFGQKYTDDIRGNWGSLPFEDIMKGLDFLLVEFPWIDKTRVSACGGSYGGFMINWIAGNAPGVFTSLVVHDGIFDTHATYYSTEELWFPEWEFLGTPWNNPDLYAKWNPASKVQDWNTPTLVIHGGRDYRLDISQGLMAFTGLQRNGIESELLYFPLENHWVLNPNNGIKWYHSVIDWLDRHNKQ